MRTAIAISAACLTLSLAGCGDSAPEEPDGPASGTTIAVPESCVDPLAGNPETVNARELAFCEAEAIADIEGYVQMDYFDGRHVSTSRVNINPLAVEIRSDPDSENGNWVILVAGKAYVHQEGNWVEARRDSDDEHLAYQSTLPDRFEALLNPNIRAAGTDATLEYTVVGNETVNGYETTVLSLLADDGSTSGQVVENRVYVRDDYVVVRSQTTSEAAGTKHVRLSSVKDIDEPQEIVNPLYGESGVDG